MILHPENFSNDPESSLLYGGKASALAKLASTKLPIPPWFVVPAQSNTQDTELTHAAKQLDTSTFAIRSSGVQEDGKEQSFAGQYDSFLFVPIEEVIPTVQKVHNSHSNERIQSYSQQQNLEGPQLGTLEHSAPSAIVQVMLTPKVSGVAFSANPVSGNLEETIVSAAYGVGSGIVSGDIDTDQWVIEKETITNKIISNKAYQHLADPSSEEGVSRQVVSPSIRELPCLPEKQVLEVAQLAQSCEEHFRCPQDIEWCYHEDTLFLLQSRPITTLPKQTAATDVSQTIVWDNSNIAESYSGMTSPLTFSFAQRAYEHVYREFCTLLSVPKKTIQSHDTVFSKMLGHIRGRVFYNLNSWYHVLAMLPGFSINRGFMEQMMGVKEPMPEEIVQEILSKTNTSKWKDTRNLLFTMRGLIKRHKSLSKDIQSFYQRLDKALATPEKPLGDMSSAELNEHYLDLEKQLLRRWDAPLVNDFFAMIYYGVLRKLSSKWLGKEEYSNELLLHSNDIISAEPPRKIKSMASIVARSPKLLTILTEQPLNQKKALRSIDEHTKLSDLYQNYLDTFGDRCLEELKLESPTVADNPSTLLSSIGAMAKRVQENGPKPKPLPQKAPVNLDTFDLCWWEKKVFRFVLKKTRELVAQRENLRFERTRLFGRVRQIMRELGVRYANQNILTNKNDIFHLPIESIIFDNEQQRKSWKETVNHSKKNQEAQQIQTPPDRFTTQGIPSETETLKPTAKIKQLSDSQELKGIGACPGWVQGTVRVVDDPRHAVLKEGEILVAQQTDPGWVVLFPAASGLLVERGSLLSHSAIVARELNLPCIVSIPAVTSRLRTGNRVAFDGATGEIQLLSNYEE